MMSRVIRKIQTTIFKLINWKVFSTSVLYAVPKVYYTNRLHIGNNVHINDSVFIHAVGGINIGDNCVLSYGVSLISTGLDTHQWKNRNVYLDTHKNKSIFIGENVWIGANTTVCAGVNIASHCIIAAGAVVTKDLDEENCLYGGIPAKKIKKL